MQDYLNSKTKLASIPYTQGRFGLSESAYYKKTLAQRNKLRRKAYNERVKDSKGTVKRKTKAKKSTKKSFFQRLFG